MASIIDSIKTVAGDSHPFLKIASFSLIVFFVVQLNALNNILPFFKIIAIVLAVLGFMGFALSSVHNAINEQLIVIPNLFNPIKLIGIGILGFVSLLPFIAIVYFGITSLMPLLTFEPWINYMVLIMAFAILSSFLIVAMLLFCKSFNPISAYNFKYTLKYIGDFIVSNFMLAFSLFLLVGIVFFPIGLGVKILFNYGEIFTYYCTFSIVFIIMCMMQYYAQLHFEYIVLIDD